MAKTIIVADDDEMYRIVMHNYLTRMGFEVILNASGDKVLDQVKQYQPAACIIDIVMEGKEGIQTMLELTDIPDRPKLIAFSGNQFYLSLASELGIDALLSKPVTLESLKETLDKLGVSP